MHPYFYNHEPTHDPHNHPDKLDVILVVSNTRMYESRYRLFKQALEHVESTHHVRVHVCEMAYGERPFVIAKHECKQNLLLRSSDELWHKENMINLAIKRLPEDWKYVCWMDADIEFLHKDWAKRTIEALQHYMVVQPWSSAIDLGPNGHVVNNFQSFCWAYCTDQNIQPSYDYYGGNKKYVYPHSGYVWAARRDFFNTVGGLLDVAILGAGDHHMSWALIGMADQTFPGGAETPLPEYRREVYHWQDRALKYVKKNIGYVPGTICHHWHGKKKDRKYSSRWEGLSKYAFNPDTDLFRDWQGLWKLRVENERQIGLRDWIREYMASRNEDSIDEERI